MGNFGNLIASRGLDPKLERRKMWFGFWAIYSNRNTPNMLKNRQLQSWLII